MAAGGNARLFSTDRGCGSHREKVELGYLDDVNTSRRPQIASPADPCAKAPLIYNPDQPSVWASRGAAPEALLATRQLQSKTHDAANYGGI